ncbi:oxidoreductase [Strigomonas culicis]|uniref:Oxidoreductase n=1 Tax=Strigomonas culicis TaxID=28005 RepID=S9U2Z7_9TRYP|nr:oxidoreductase [Strigomonas culicis]|eukprot:EPY25157.1 oxidoreductase [Strigomonas culicis]
MSAPVQLPSTYRKLVVTQLTPDFRKATEIVTTSFEAELQERQALEKAKEQRGSDAGAATAWLTVKVAYVGINASDVNFASGRYFRNAKTPFGCGFEAIGEVVAVSAGADAARAPSVGAVVTFMQYGAFAEYVDVPAALCTVLPELKPEYLVLTLSGLTAAVALGEVGDLEEPESLRAARAKEAGQPVAADEAPRPTTRRRKAALVTAAAGGTGHVAVQLLKHYYHFDTVIGTCSSEDKAAYLRSIGCDVAINYKTEDLDARLTEVAPSGLDLVYEGVGGQTFNTATAHLAQHGRLIIIGSVTSYQHGDQVEWAHPQGVPLSSLLLRLSASLQGFFLPNHRASSPAYMARLLRLVQAGTLRLAVDQHCLKELKGLEQVVDGVEYLFTSKSAGKVVVPL